MRKGRTATDTTPNNLTAATSSSFSITIGAATQVVFTTQPIGNVIEGTNFGTQPVVSAEDVGGNVVTTSNVSTTLSIQTYTPGNGGTTQGTLGCTTNPMTPSSGVATFAGCNITGTAGAGTSFNSYNCRCDGGYRPKRHANDGRAAVVFQVLPGADAAQHAARVV